MFFGVFLTITITISNAMKVHHTICVNNTMEMNAIHSVWKIKPRDFDEMVMVMVMEIMNALEHSSIAANVDRW